ncbi:MaoC/PaaZ C-terminal domain-containing protein [Ottowia testudinis]|uniref:MaoC family dehydratase N-terminal domain-containing protein n=1 Tax=Ottowia testudinis TaxID=2816950 RepID=A0A975CHT4_9BURK|nr:MaoC/PaaZ C-terminal domain-containing protein [Ottowia testudinis]QTD46450.1 MaoC family dehydratase N-terminal domain-containing protein [Ottowia testudinis]
MISVNPSSNWIESHPDVIENVPFADLRVGMRARLTRRVTRETIEHFAESTGDFNPAHLDEHYANSSRFGGVIAHGMWSGALLSAVLGTLLPGPGTIYLEQTLKYLKPVRPGDVLSAEVTVAAIDAERRRVELECQVRNQNGDAVVSGVATVLAPKDKITRPRPLLQVI